MDKNLGQHSGWPRKFFWFLFLTFLLISCSQETPIVPTEVVDKGGSNPSPSVTSTITPVPATTTELPPSPTNTSTPESPTETSPPTETPTITPTLWPTNEPYFDGARVTFINNAGFMITVGDKKILIDALYNTFSPNTDIPDPILQRAINAQSPFDQVDLALATHDHADHFSPDLVRAHLQHNETAVFVSSQSAVRRMISADDGLADRLIAVDLDYGESTHLTVNGIEIDCLYITHGDPAILNIGYVITVGGYTFFHSGDMNLDGTLGDAVSLADLQSYQLPQKEIDLAFLPSYIFSVEEYISLIEEGILARYVTPIHYPYQYPPTWIEENFSNAVVFKDTLENWVVPLEGK